RFDDREVRDIASGPARSPIPTWRLLPPAKLARMTTQPRDGGCACGAVRYRLASAPMFVHCCHCLDCQRQTGSAFVINALIEADRGALFDAAPVEVAGPTDSGRP